MVTDLLTFPSLLCIIVAAGLTSWFLGLVFDEREDDDVDNRDW